jgi:hypothetical protein
VNGQLLEQPDGRTLTGELERKRGRMGHNVAILQ